MADGLSPEERDTIAAELALGVLDGAARAAALRRLMADPDFSPDMIDAWERRLAPLYDDYVAVTPPETLWPGIETAVAGGLPAHPALRQLRWWRAGALASAAVAASLALIVLLRPGAPVAIQQPAQVAMAQMVGEPDGPMILARYDPTSGGLVLRPTGVASGRLAPELWIIPADGKPRSLGLIGGGAESRIAVAPSYRRFMAEGATLAVTMESMAGAPHDAPSSAPIAAGKISLF
ncbi:anti-sigma factor [Sphingobium sp. 3R8]|uniref:anti-sigma factor n=1 Tax=Sphingobium sp. 3R8 TaxID=2874921 RepID=UPI001CCD42F8|nr:anti-sigma factor [Sphingobium sp. 3R8]MBZ9648359.1 anti-sigma factor [Sphingobium sp. 3R8]